MPRRPVNSHDSYHAHIYFGPQTVDQAAALAVEAWKKFNVPLGRMHRKPVGPHPQWSVQMVFGRDQFDAFVPWLDEHRGGLDVFIHGVTGDDLLDHTQYAYWLGNEHPLDLSKL